MSFKHLATACAFGTLALAGCGGGSDGEASGTLQEGIYEAELTEKYLLENRISKDQAANESGTHELMLSNGSFADRWQSANGTTGFCSGTYKEDGTRVTFTWVSGCFGNWAMSYAIDGDQVTWSDIEALAPNDSAEDQHAAEVFNGVTWTRVEDTPES